MEPRGKKPHARMKIEMDGKCAVQSCACVLGVLAVVGACRQPRARAERTCSGEGCARAGTREDVGEKKKATEEKQKRRNEGRTGKAEGEGSSTH